MIAPVGQASGHEDPLAKADPWSAKVLEGDLGFSFDFLTSEFSEGECELCVELLRYSSILKLPSGISSLLSQVRTSCLQTAAIAGVPKHCIT